MAILIKFRFLATSATINSASGKLKIRPNHDCQVDEIGLINIDYSILGSGVNVRIKNPSKRHNMTNLSVSFRKEIEFEVINSGSKKHFTLQAKATYGTTAKLSNLSIIYL